jgi:hypothetical protein
MHQPDREPGLWVIEADYASEDVDQLQNDIVRRPSPVEYARLQQGKDPLMNV